MLAYCCFVMRRDIRSLCSYAVIAASLLSLVHLETCVYRVQTDASLSRLTATFNIISLLKLKIIIRLVRLVNRAGVFSYLLD